ncbi:ATP-binding protein [Bacillus sp. PK3-037]
MNVQRRLTLSNVLIVLSFVIINLIFSSILPLIYSGNEEFKKKKITEEIKSYYDFSHMEDAVEKFNHQNKNNGFFMTIYHEGNPIIYPNKQEIKRNTEQLLSSLSKQSNQSSMEVRADGVEISVFSHRGYDFGFIQQPHINTFRKVFTVAVGTLLIIGLAIFFLNIILTRFVLRSIQLPLDTLVEGIQRISQGELNYRIDYKRKDEFFSVCQDFNNMAHRLEELTQQRKKDEISRKELIAGISHDLRTPLTSIKAYVEGLIDGVAKDTVSQKRYLQTIKEKTEDIDQLVDKLFLFSKLELEEFPLHRKKINVTVEIFNLLETVRDEYQSKGLTLSLDKRLNNVFIYADALYLRTAFINIIENSVKYKNKEHGHLTVSIFEKKNRVYITLTDDGPGVPDESLNSLFDTFYRNDGSRQNPNQGSGLGLAITKKILHHHGGDIHAQNVPEGGLCIIISLPKHTVDTEEYDA